MVALKIKKGVWNNASKCNRKNEKQERRFRIVYGPFLDAQKRAGRFKILQKLGGSFKFFARSQVLNVLDDKTRPDYGKNQNPLGKNTNEQNF